MMLLTSALLGFTTLDTKEAAWVDPVTKSVHKIRTASGVCVDVGGGFSSRGTATEERYCG